MIPQDKISFIKGTFRGKYNGSLNQRQVASLHKVYSVNILPNSLVSDAEFTTDYSEIANNQDSVRLSSLNEVNLIFDKSKIANAINSKEGLSNVVITDYKIENVGKEGLDTHGELSGTFYGTITPPDFKVEEKKEIEKIIPPVTPIANAVETPVATTPSSTVTEPLAPISRGWNLGGCLTRLLQLLGLLFLLSLLLNKCNSCNPPAPVPTPTLDSLSQDRKDTMQFQSSNATITMNDWDRPDNDRITVKVNNEVVVNDMLITAAPKSFQIKNLHQGNNSLEIIPTAFGLGDCTATIEIGDSKNTFRFECDIKKGETVKKNLFVK